MEKFKNIIFDYGNVIFAIDFKITQQALIDLGIQNVEQFYAHKGHHPLFDDFETGKTSPAQFREGIRAAANNLQLSDQEIDDAWNSLLLGVSGNNHQVLKEVQQKYRSFLLSNNNQIHYDWIIDYLKREFNMDNYDDYFEKAYFSQQTGMRKPNPEIFEMVIEENKINPAETLFIDDSPQHLEGAKKVGLNTLLMDVHPSALQQFLIQHQLL
jgi:putative hydrolase of the HAD superfamily